MKTIEGVDSSAVAGNERADFKKAHAAGVRFVLLRATFDRTIDRHFVRHYHEAKAAGLQVGSYFFWHTVLSVPEQVHAMIAALKAIGGDKPEDLPPFVDLEFGGGLNHSRHGGVTPAGAVERVNSIRSALAAELGYQPGLYTSARVCDAADELHGEPFPVGMAEMPLWLVAWRRRGTKVEPPKPKIPSQYRGHRPWLHQYEGDAGKTVKVPGFPGVVDLNRFSIMEIGETGPTVAWVQRRLDASRTHFGHPLVFDGTFGPKTEAAVKLFQGARGLVADGKIGPLTFARLARAAPL